MNFYSKKFSISPSKLLINSTSPPGTSEIGHELGIIKSNFGREIAALKEAISGEQRHEMKSSASSVSTRRFSSESIKSSAKWNEKMAEISSDDKLSTIIDDGKESTDDRSVMRRRLMKKQEIDNGSKRNYHASVDANESFQITSDAELLPQDESFN